MLTQYDKDNIEEILHNQGKPYDWYTAYVLRFLDKAVFKADRENLAKLYSMWPEEVRLIFSHAGWSDQSIDRHLGLDV